MGGGIGAKFCECMSCSLQSMVCPIMGFRVLVNPLGGGGGGGGGGGLCVQSLCLQILKQNRDIVPRYGSVHHCMHICSPPILFPFFFISACVNTRAVAT